MEKTEKYDFRGWATKNNIRCSDGRTILKDAFKHCDGQTVPLVWNHQHDDPSNVLGHALLKNCDEGVYAYCSLNETEQGEIARVLVKHGDVKSLSIYANQLQQDKGNVLHGSIREVSLVLAGANPGAKIEQVIVHSESGEFIRELKDEAVMYTGEGINLYHAEEQQEEKKEEPMAEETKNEKTVKDVFDSMTEEQKTVVYAMIGQALEDAGDENDDDSEGGNNMKHNVFDNDEQDTVQVLSHSDMTEIFKKAKTVGSLKEAYLQHADISETEYATRPEVWGPAAVDATKGTQNYGVYDPSWLFPEARTLNNPPEFIKRDTGWVAKVMTGVHHTPFSRIKSLFADIREEDARARGYIKGKLKKEEVFGLLKRTTTPTTIYKKQKMDRDDVTDIVSFDVIAWIKGEMRVMLDEELARAFLIGDGRSTSSDDKINEQNIRPIWTDEDLFTIKKTITYPENATDDQKAKAFIRTAIKARKEYKGSGEPTLWTTEDVLTDLLLIEDSTGRVIYDTLEKLKNALRVKDIVTVPVMENAKRNDDGKTKALMGIIVNLKDYNVGADKGGAVNMFEDFDIDYNQQKYLIETRCSGALIKPFSAIALEVETAAE